MEAKTTPESFYAWKPPPNLRRTSDILITCGFTLFLCAWTALHINIPKKGGAFSWKQTRREFEVGDHCGFHSWMGMLKSFHHFLELWWLLASMIDSYPGGLDRLSSVYRGWWVWTENVRRSPTEKTSASAATRVEERQVRNLDRCFVENNAENVRLDLKLVYVGQACQWRPRSEIWL